MAAVNRRSSRAAEGVWWAAWVRWHLRVLTPGWLRAVATASESIGRYLRLQRPAGLPMEQPQVIREDRLAGQPVLASRRFLSFTLLARTRTNNSEVSSDG